MKCLSIRQPWAWLIVNGHKGIENRTWLTNHRGPVLIHASNSLDGYAYHGDVPAIAPDIKLPSTDELWSLSGGIVGVAEIVDCVTKDDSRWFFGPYGFKMTNARLLPFVPMKGRLGLFEAPPEILKQLGL